jgi:glycosyltransferase involved in cell wall biosynthesis
MATPKTELAVGYVLKRFPVLSETFILNEILALEARGVGVHIFSLERPNDPRFHDDLPKLKARVSYVPDIFDLPRLRQHNKRLRKSCGKAYYRAFRYALARMRPALLWRFLQAGYVANEARRLKVRQLHAHFANRPATVAFFASRITGIPFSFTAHAMDIFKETVSVRALRRKIEAARFVVAVSEFNKAYLEDRMKGRPARIVRLYNGINLDRFAPNSTLPPPPFTILSVARLVEKKGLPVLIEACRLLRERQVPFRCWIAGKGRQRPELEDLIQRWSLRDEVRLLGPLTQMEVLKRYHASHVYSLPCIVGPDGNRDGLPVSIVEALACGLPVVTTPVTGIPEVVRDRHNGLIVPSDNAAALADAIESLARDGDLYAKLRENARASVASTFDLRETAAALHDLMERGPTETRLEEREPAESCPL